MCHVHVFHKSFYQYSFPSLSFTYLLHLCPSLSIIFLDSSNSVIWTSFLSASNYSLKCELNVYRTSKKHLLTSTSITYLRSVALHDGISDCRPHKSLFSNYGQMLNKFSHLQQYISCLLIGRERINLYSDVASLDCPCRINKPWKTAEGPYLK